jgi:predicted DNA-binding transcriptional regulator AlpA
MNYNMTMTPQKKTGRRSKSTKTHRFEPTGKLLMLQEMAAMFHLAKHTLWLYTQRPDFPPPEDVLSSGAVWRRSDVEKWAKKHLLETKKLRRKPGEEEARVVVTGFPWHPDAYGGSFPRGRPPGT